MIYQKEGSVEMFPLAPKSFIPKIKEGFRQPIWWPSSKKRLKIEKESQAFSQERDVPER